MSASDTGLSVATYNINGIKARLPALLSWLEEAKPDIVALQEIKSVDDQFPRLEIEALGYHVETHGQKSFNGVALLSRMSPLEVSRGLPGGEANGIDGGDDEQARYIEALYPHGAGTIRVCGLYLPNGNPVDDPAKFGFKLRWMERLHARARDLMEAEESFVLVGDYNVIPQAADCHDPAIWAGDALFRPESRSAFYALCGLGLTDAVRAVNPDAKTYTFWDYQAGAWQKNNGIRIDHILMSPEAADHLQRCRIDAHVRAWEKPSDHVPVIAHFG